MRITLVTETFFPAVDGTTTTVKAVVDRLVDTGHEVQLIAPGPGLSDVPRLPGRPDPARSTRSADRSARRSRRSGPDLVHVTSPRTVGRKALKHADRLGVPAVVVEQSPLLDVSADYWRTRVAERAAQVLVTSGWMVDRVADLGGEPALWAPGRRHRRLHPGAA